MNGKTGNAAEDAKQPENQQVDNNFKTANAADNPIDADGKTARDREREAAAGGEFEFPETDDERRERERREQF